MLAEDLLMKLTVGAAGLARAMSVVCDRILPVCRCLHMNSSARECRTHLTFLGVFGTGEGRGVNCISPTLLHPLIGIK